MKTHINVFKQNNHSKWRISYHIVTPEVRLLVEKVFMTHYAKASDIVSLIEQVDEAEINSNNFRVTYLRGGTEEHILIRRYPNNRDRVMLEDIAIVAKYLLENGANVPEIVTSHSGNVIEVVDKHSFTAYRFIDGHHFRGTLEEIKDAGRKIGELDKLLASLPRAEELKVKVAFPSHQLSLRHYSAEIWKNLFAIAEEGSATSEDKEFDLRFVAAKEFILIAVENTPFMFAEDFEKQLVHFDLHPHNLISDGTQLLAIIDLDSLRVFERMRAVSFALHRLVRQYIVYNELKDIKKAVVEAKSVYIEAYREYMPLTEKDVRAIPYFIRTEALARLSYAMKDNYLNGNPLWKGDLDKQMVNISEAVYFES